MTSANSQSKGNNPVAGQLEVVCPNPEDLRPLVEAIAMVVEPGDILLLHGALGAGKTTLTQLLATALDVSEDQYVSSPSFALMHEYTGRLPIFHMDLYRLSDEEDVEAAGLVDALTPHGLCIIEWPDRLGSLSPDHRLDISIVQESPIGRRIILTPHGPSWVMRMGRIVEHLHQVKQ
mgnify:CR=1 FL=1